MVSRIVKRLAIVAAICLGGIFALLTLLWVEHRTPFDLPASTGRFPVGRTTYAWVNDAAGDNLAPTSSKRHVLVWIWYPAAPSPSAQPADYQPAPWRAALARYSGPLITNFLTRDPAIVRTHSAADPPVSPAQPSYPVVIMRAGGGALTTEFTTLAEDLASHGYIVAGFDAPYRTAVVVLPDGRVIERPPALNPENLPDADQMRLINRILPMWVEDTRFVVDQLARLNADPTGRFTGRLDLQHLGMFGHSFGGATALQFCHDDARCIAGIDIDGNPFGSVVQDGLTQPFLILLSDHGSEAGSGEVYAKIRSIFDRLPNGRLMLMIRGANHFSFSDSILLRSQYVVNTIQRIRRGPDARRGLAITADYVHTFFDVHLKGAFPEGLDTLRTRYPEVQLLH